MAKPPFPWIGSKEKIAPYILQLFPPKLTQYVEPFGGSGAVLLALPPDPNRLDIYNDLDAELVNLFSCIKECSNVLLRELKFLPIHGRKLFEYYAHALHLRPQPARPALVRHSGGGLILSPFCRIGSVRLPSLTCDMFVLQRFPHIN